MTAALVVLVLAVIIVALIFVEPLLPRDDEEDKS